METDMTTGTYVAFQLLKKDGRWIIDDIEFDYPSLGHTGYDLTVEEGARYLEQWYLHREGKNVKAEWLKTDASNGNDPILFHPGAYHLYRITGDQVDTQGAVYRDNGY